ncbi:hypothetical protein BYT27DRAFT_7340795 [Phlegmacium glaucopus]|nr:hypothetical protein BYT27DRAFT_7340795 [Phlegmacium glaucopus]
MGSAASKTARRYPKPSRVPTTEATSKNRLADSHRTKEIEQDAGDPDFLANLSRLGPVRVNHSMETIRPDPMGSTTSRLFESRAKPEFEASSPHLAKNHLYSSTLTELLNQRKSTHTQKDLEKLSMEFGIEVDKLERLARYVTSPSVISTAIHSVGKDGEGVMTTVHLLRIPITSSHLHHAFLFSGSVD